MKKIRISCLVMYTFTESVLGFPFLMLLERSHSFPKPTFVLGWSNLLVKMNTMNSQCNLSGSFFQTAVRKCAVQGWNDSNIIRFYFQRSKTYTSNMTPSAINLALMEVIQCTSLGLGRWEEEGIMNLPC